MIVTKELLLTSLLSPTDLGKILVKWDYLYSWAALSELVHYRILSLYTKRLLGVKDANLTFLIVLTKKKPLNQIATGWQERKKKSNCWEISISHSEQTRAVILKSRVCTDVGRKSCEIVSPSLKNLRGHWSKWQKLPATEVETAFQLGIHWTSSA